MELKKWPETPMEYYSTIEGLGAFVFTMTHDMNKGRIKDTNGGVKKDIEKSIEIQKKLALEIEEKFGVVFPEDRSAISSTNTLSPLPEGKIYYRDWYEKLKLEELNQFFNKTICSACPMSYKDRAKANGKMCKYYVSEKMMEARPVYCGAIDHFAGETFKNYAEFYKKIKIDYGYAALIAFKNKRSELFLSLGWKEPQEFIDSAV